MLRNHATACVCNVAIVEFTDTLQLVQHLTIHMGGTPVLREGLNTKLLIVLFTHCCF